MLRLSRTSSLRAFTLIESMMAVVVLAFAVVGLTSVLMAATENAQASESKIVAVYVARNDMELLLASKLNDLSPSNGSATDEVIPAASLSTPSQTVTHTGAIKYISRSASQTARDLAVIKVVTTTPDGQTITFQRLVTRAGASQ